MNRQDFWSDAPGRLIPVQTPRGGDWSFLPFDLPPNWVFDASLWPLLVQAKEALGTLNGIGQTLGDPRLLLSPLQNREAITSSIIEGTYVTPEQLLLFDLDPDEETDSAEHRADRVEVANYGRSLRRGLKLLESLPICIRVIREMHETLMQGVRGESKDPGRFRTLQVQVGTDGRFMPPPASDIERLMRNLERYANSEGGLDPLVRSFIIHYQFETIHPFLDGNGRVGRALLALMIQKLHGHAHPWLYLSAYFEQYKDDYIRNLYRISTENNWVRWIEFCLHGALHQARDSIRRCARFNVLRAEFHHRVKQPSPRTHQLIDELFREPITTITATAAKHAITYPTAKKDLELLVEARIIAELQNRRPKAYGCLELLQAAYDIPGDERNS